MDLCAVRWVGGVRVGVGEAAMVVRGLVAVVGDGGDGLDGGEWGGWGEVAGCLERAEWKGFVTSREGWGGALGVGEGCVRFLIGEDGLLRIFAGMWRGLLERMSRSIG